MSVDTTRPKYSASANDQYQERTEVGRSRQQSFISAQDKRNYHDYSVGYEWRYFTFSQSPNVRIKRLSHGTTLTWLLHLNEKYWCNCSKTEILRSVSTAIGKFLHGHVCLLWRFLYRCNFPVTWCLWKRSILNILLSTFCSCYSQSLT